MNFKTTYVLFGGFAVLLVALLVVVIVTNTGGDEADNKRLFPFDKANKVSASDVEQVTIDVKGGDKYVFEREGKFGWKMTSPRATPADTASVESVVSALLNSSFDESRDAVSVRERNLDKPTRVVTLVTKDKDRAPLTLTVGDVDPGTEGFAYVVASERPDRGGAVRKRAIEAALEGFAFYRAKEVFVGDTADVTSVKISDGTNTVEVEKTAKGWRAKQPDYGNEPVTVGFLQALGNLRVEYRSEKENDFAGDLDKLPEAKELLAGKQLKIEVGRGADAKSAKKTTLVVLTGKKFADKAKDEDEKKAFGKPEEKYYAYVEDGAKKEAIKLSVSSVEPLEKVLTDRDALRSRTLLALDGAIPDAVDVTDTNAVEGTMSFRRTAEGWALYRNGEAVPTDRQAVEALVGTLSNAAAVVNFVPVGQRKEMGLESPRVVVKVWANSLAKADKKDDKKMPAFEKDAKPVTELKFGKTTKEGNVAIERVWGDQTTLVTAADALLRQVQKRPLSYYDKTLPPVAAGGVTTKLEFTRNGEPVEVTRAKAGEPWKIVRPASLKDRTANDDVVDGVIDAVRGMKAEEIVSEKAGADVLKEYGLSPAKSRVVLTQTKDGKETKHEYDFGNDAPGGRGVYARLDGKDVVYVVENKVSAAASKELRDTTVFNFDAGDVKTVKLTGWYSRDEKLATVTLERAGERWTIKERPDLSADQAKVEGALRTLANLKAVAFVPSGRGFDEKEDALKIEVTAGDKTYELTVGGESGGNAYFARSPQMKGETFTVSKDVFGLIKEKPLSFAQRPGPK